MPTPPRADAPSALGAVAPGAAGSFLEKKAYWDNGKENGNYYSILGLYRGYIGIMEKKMENVMLLKPLRTGVALSGLMYEAFIQFLWQ